MSALDELRELLQTERRDAAEHAPGGLAAAAVWPCELCAENSNRTDLALARVEAELAALRETNQKLNRRCQSAGQGLAAKLDSAGGASLGRALANAAATMYHAQLAERDAELAELRTLVYLPSTWRCKTCGYVEEKNFLDPRTGGVSANPEPALPCPNDGEYLVRETWKQHAEDCAERCIESFSELAALRTRPTLEQVLGTLRAPGVAYRLDWYVRSVSVEAAIRALYGEAETTERPNG